eukprot:jgi/Tetstr1/461974/TSEL_007047.t1
MSACGVAHRVHKRCKDMQTMRNRLPSREVKVHSRKSKAITKADLPALSGHEVQKMLEDPNKEIKEGFRKGNNHRPQRLLKSGKVTLCKTGQVMKRNTLMAHHHDMHGPAHHAQL